MDASDNDTQQLHVTAQIVAAYVGNNSLPSSELSALIKSVDATLSNLSQPEAQVDATPSEPAVAINKSIKPDHLVCLCCGKSFKSLKRHLRTAHNMTPEEYRKQWGLAHDYPMVAPDYTETRSKIAKDLGLGNRRKG